MSSVPAVYTPPFPNNFLPNAGKGRQGAVNPVGRWGYLQGVPRRVQALSDSILARGSHSPWGMKLDSIPLWKAGLKFNGGNVCRNAAGHLYYTTAAGIAAVEPTHTSGNVADGTLNWFYYAMQEAKDSSSELFWMEKFANGTLEWRNNEAYEFPYLSLGKVIVISGGQGYAPGDSIAFSVVGAEAQLNIDPLTGAISSVTVTNCGYNTSGFLDYTLTSKGGSGAVLSLVHTCNGTFGVSGCRTRDGRARLPDVLNHPNKPDVLVVSLGSNDGTLDVTTLANAQTVAASVIEDLRYIYRTATAAGILVVAKPPPVKSNLTPPIIAFRNKVRNFIRAFARGETWANPEQVEILHYDPCPLLQDSSTPYDPIGGNGGSYGAVTVDGTHNNALGAQVCGYLLYEALLPIAGSKLVRPRESGSAFGYDLTYNPGGNLFEALPWVANTQREVNQWCSNDSGKLYRCVVAGVTAGAGGPTGTGSNIVDGGAQWTYIRQGGLSALNSGTAGVQTATGTIVYSGTNATGTTISRLAGTATGTVACTQPTYSGAGNIKGQSQKIVFTLSGGGATESWRLLISNLTLAAMGIPNSDLGVVPYSLEVDMQISGISFAMTPYIQLFSQAGILACSDGTGQYSGAPGAVGWEMMPSSGGFFPYPNNGRYVWKTPKAVLPAGVTSLNAGIFFPFNATTAATLTVEIFNLRLVREDQN